MAYFDATANEAVWLQGRSVARTIRLGDAERRVILTACHDRHARRGGRQLADGRLEALRRYTTVGDRSAAAANMLQNAGFSPAERRIVDAMIGAIPPRVVTARPATSRLVFAALILIPLLAAIGGYSWANAYLQDRLIAIVVAGLALLMVMPFAGAMLAPMPRGRPVR
ncbi:MAG TPA: hypothetical protein VNT42_08810 [Sphingomonas sp.]|nr:hypothetical protein [Sphingomonas sp.]